MHVRKVFLLSNMEKRERKKSTIEKSLYDVLHLDFRSPSSVLKHLSLSHAQSQLSRTRTHDWRAA